MEQYIYAICKDRWERSYRRFSKAVLLPLLFSILYILFHFPTTKNLTGIADISRISICTCISNFVVNIIKSTYKSLKYLGLRVF